jgi:TRAP-type C4-dicarboxylate transport system permease small subunit
MSNAIGANHPPRWFTFLDRFIRMGITWFSCVLLVLMVLFTAYTVVMRYVFNDPPFWGDTVALFCNMGLVFIAYSLAVREGEDISSQAVHAYLPVWGVKVLIQAWEVMTIAFGLFLAWFGLEAALAVPGQFWELGGLPKMIPMMVLPISGLLVAITGSLAIMETVFGWKTSG